VFVWSQAAKRVNCMQKLLLSSRKIIKREYGNCFLFSVMFAFAEWL
jgi:hypothetical protein